MPLKISCSCGARFKAKDELAGKQVECSACGQQLIVPQRAVADSMIRVECECGKTFGAKPELAGRKVTCPVCYHALQVPTASDQASSPPTPAGNTSIGTPPAAYDPMNLNSMTFPAASAMSFGGANSGYSTASQFQKPTRPVPSRKKPSQFGANARALKLGVVVTVSIVMAIARFFSCNETPENRSMAFNSPKSVFNDFRQAIIAKDWSKAAAQLSPDERRRQVSASLAVLAITAGNNEEAAAILEEHGLTIEEVTSRLRPVRNREDAMDVDAAMTQLLRKVRNQTGLIGDCWGWMYELPGREEEQMFGYVLKSELTDLVFNEQPEYFADMASGTVRYEANGRMIETEWIFSRAGDYWQIEQPGVDGID